MQPVIKDFDKVVRQERKVVLAGEKIDVSRIPSRVSLEMMQLSKSDKMKSDDGFYELIGMVAKACQPSNKKVTADWLFDNTDIETLLELVEFVIEPIMNKAKEKNIPVDDSGKN